MSSSQVFFKKMVDDLVTNYTDDIELKKRLEWIDKEYREKNESFYDAVFRILYNYDISTKAKQFMRDHTHD